MPRSVALGLLATALAYPVVALALIASQPAAGPLPDGAGLAFDALLAADYADLPSLEPYRARDGARLAYRAWPGARTTDTVLVLLHGSAWHGMQFAPLAASLSRAGVAHVVAPDLRGHGPAPARRGDVDYVGQLEDDLADLLDLLERRWPDARVVVGGHSSGGGLALRFAGGPHGDRADAYLLLAPFLQHDAPTTRRDAGGWARPLTRRLAGLAMLHRIGIHALDHLTVLRFAVPAAVLDGPYGATATPAYSYRLNASYAPRRDWRRDLRALDQPFLLVAGTAHEAFVAEAYEPTISRHTDAGAYALLPGVGHLDLLTDPAARHAVAAWLSAGPPAPRPAPRPSPAASRREEPPP